MMQLRKWLTAERGSNSFVYAGYRPVSRLQPKWLISSLGNWASHTPRRAWVWDSSLKNRILWAMNDSG